MNPTLRIRLIALAAVVALGAAAGLYLLPRGGETITVTAYFSKAIGLFSQSQVRVLGVSIGRVTAVEPVGERVKVTMKLEKDRKVPDDARAVIVPISLIADRYIQLTPVWESGPTLRDGDVIGVDRTAVPAELDDVLAQLKKFLDAIEPGTRENPSSLGLAVRNLSKALAGVGGDLSATLGGAGALSGSIASNAPKVEAIVGQLSRLGSALAARRSDIAAMNTNLAGALGAIANERAALDKGLTNVALLTEQLGSLVKDHRPTLEKDLAILAKTTTAVLRHQDSVIRSLEWLHVLADGAERHHPADNDGAVHDPPNGPNHIDVRDAHLTPCAVGPPAVCLLLGLTGGSLAADIGLAAVQPTETAQPTESSPAPSPVAPDPLDILDLLPSVELPFGASAASATPEPSPTPGAVRSFFDRVGGLIDGAFGWLM